MECRVGCGACCIVWPIKESYLNHPNGKAGGERCKNLTEDNKCGIYEIRPQSCRNFEASYTMCGDTFEEAFSLQTILREVIDSPMETALLDKLRD